MNTMSNEKYNSGGFLVEEAPGYGSRDVVAFDNTAGTADLTVEAGTVFSIAAFAAPIKTASASNSGNGSLSGMSAAQGSALLGNYSVNLVSPTAFTVTAPDGRQLAQGIVGTPYLDEIDFTLTAGSLAFTNGDSFTIGIAPGPGLASAFTGAAPAAGIVWTCTTIAAGATEKVVTIRSKAEVSAAYLRFPAALPPGAMAAAISQLRSLGIIAR